MRAILNAVLSYGLMNVPVGVATAASRKDLAFRTLHKKCGLPINQSKVCAHCQAANLQDYEVVKGFEFTKKNFIMLDQEELDSVGAERSKVIAVKKFVSFDDVDELQVEKSYYLEPNSMLSRPYTLLSNAMGAKEVVGIATSYLWGKEYPSMVWAKESGALVLSMLYCHDEMVADTEIVEAMGLVPEEEQDAANEFVAYMTRDLDPASDFVSTSRRRVNEYIAAKVAGLDFEIPASVAELEPTLDVMGTLRSSIELARKSE